MDSPDDILLHEIYDKIKSIYANAYNWSPPDVRGVQQAITTKMRHYVKGWITEWDLKRKYPQYEPEIKGEEMRPDYSEDQDL